MEAMQALQVRGFQILTTVPHSSLRKAASIVGLGHLSVKDVGRSDAPHRFDLAALKSALSTPEIASIVVVSCGEVNTGAFATNGEDMLVIRDLCYINKAWLHIDAAFGLQASLLPKSDSAYGIIAEGVRGLSLADSITGDAHKLLNVVRTSDVVSRLS
jgi:glutamate/tyrosine decarboxylase-like PLP-dependent enzyme